MDYLWLKAFHIAAVVTWIGGLLVLSLAISIFSAGPLSRDVTASGAVRAVIRWDRLVTAPAMLVAWVLGLVMAVQGDWFIAPWLMIKLPLALGLSALHGMLSGGLRRLAGDPGRRPSAVQRFSGPLTLTAMTAVVVLAVTKPFAA